MEISVFIREYAPLAGERGRAFRIDPVVILAQAAIETGWGESTLCREYHNFFGITAYGLPNVWWTGRWTELSPRSLRFRIYPDDKCSFMDYCRLLRSALSPGGRHERQPYGLRQGDRLQPLHQRGERRQPGSLS